MDPTNKLQPTIFGCISFVHIHSNGRGKLDPRTVKCVFLDYSTTKKEYKCYHPPSKKILCQEMSHSLKKRATSTSLIFRGEHKRGR